MEGKFIVLEGIDGCGKTTQLNHIYEWLPQSNLINKNTCVIKTREPGGSVLGNKIRDLILANDKDNPPADLTELLLYYADRTEHLSKLIKPNLKKGNWVISDRFSASTLAYQGYGRNINLEIINQLDKIVCADLKPDLTLFLEITPEESICRRRHKMNDRIEDEGISFLKKVNDGFKVISQKENWETIPAETDEESIFKKIKHILFNNFS